MRWRRFLRDENLTRGFTLIELLVVIIIIGLLAGIAIPIFLNQKARGYEAAVVTQLSAIAKAVESAAADSAASAPVARAADGQGIDIEATTHSLNITNGVDWKIAGTTDAYCLVAWNSAGGKYRPDAPLVYDSTSGGVQGAGADCAGVPGLPAGFITAGPTPPAPTPGRGFAGGIYQLTGLSSSSGGGWSNATITISDIAAPTYEATGAIEVTSTAAIGGGVCTGDPWVPPNAYQNTYARNVTTGALVQIGSAIYTQPGSGGELGRNCPGTQWEGPLSITKTNSLSVPAGHVFDHLEWTVYTSPTNSGQVLRWYPEGHPQRAA